MPMALKSVWPVARAEEARALSALVGLGVIGTLGTWSFLPLVVSRAIADLGLDARFAGFLAAAEMAGGGVATFLASFIVHRYDRRLLTLWGLLLIALGSAVSVWANQFEVLLVSRAVTGCGDPAVLPHHAWSDGSGRYQRRLHRLSVPDHPGLSSGRMVSATSSRATPGCETHEHLQHPRAVLSGRHPGGTSRPWRHLGVCGAIRKRRRRWP